MSKSYLFLLFLMIISCGKIKPKGNIETKVEKIANYNSVELQGKFRVFFIHDNENKIELETYPNLIENLKISVENNVLKISEKRGVKGVDFYNLSLYSKNNLKKISIADSVEFNGSSEIKADDILLNISNSAKFIGAIRSKKATVDMKNYALANIKGFTDAAIFKLSDSASIISPFWQIDLLNLNAKNGSFAEVNVKNEITGNLLNTASLLYYKSPELLIKKEKTNKIEHKLEP